MEINPQNYRNLLSIKTENQLELSDSQVSNATQSAGERSSHLLKEFNHQNQMIAYYRVWEATSPNPPFRKQKGWEKYSPEGELLVREVRYSQLQDELNPTLH